VDDLASLLGDEIWWVRFRAGEALMKLREEGIARMREAAASRNEVEQRSAALVLAENGLSFAEPAEAA
jgi:HEAT repeat protein